MASFDFTNHFKFETEEFNNDLEQLYINQYRFTALPNEPDYAEFESHLQNVAPKYFNDGERNEFFDDFPIFPIESNDKPDSPTFPEGYTPLPHEIAGMSMSVTSEKHEYPIMPTPDTLLLDAVGTTTDVDDDDNAVTAADIAGIALYWKRQCNKYYFFKYEFVEAYNEASLESFTTESGDDASKLGNDINEKYWSVLTDMTTKSKYAPVGDYVNISKLYIFHFIRFLHVLLHESIMTKEQIQAIADQTIFKVGCSHITYELSYRAKLA